jgi:zinc protease
VHPYRHEIIGDMADLRTIQRDDLYDHYRTYYCPNNTVITVSGDFETEAMLARIRELYEPIPSREDPPRILRPEPPQRGEHRLTVEGPGETVYIQAAYRAPAANEPDFFPYLVLDSLLTGPTGLNMFGGGGSNKTSRLYTKLVEETDLAVSVRGMLPATIDPYLYSLTITVHPEGTPDRVIGALEEELSRLQEVLPTKDELTRASKQARALFAYGSESITNQAFWMGFSEMFASYDWFENYLDKLAAVKPEDVQRVAQTYLRPQNRVLGVYIPAAKDEEVPA